MVLVGETSATGAKADAGANTVFGRRFEDWDLKTMKRILNIYRKRTAKGATRRDIFERFEVLEAQLQTRDLRTIREVLTRGEVLTRKMLKDGPRGEEAENEVMGEDEQLGHTTTAGNSAKQPESFAQSVMTMFQPMICYHQLAIKDVDKRRFLHAGIV